MAASIQHVQQHGQGLISYLRDKSTSWPDKVKIARYFWRTEIVYSPNKYQILVDWLCTSLINKNRSKICESDEVKLWQCLKDVLQSKQLQQQVKKGQQVYLKPGFVQVLIKGLTSSHDVAYLAVDVSHCIITSSYLSHQLTARFDILVQFVQTILEVCLSSDEDLSQVVAAILAKFSQVQRQNNNQKMVTNLLSEKLLIPAVELVQRRKTDQRWQVVVRRLNQIIADGLFQKEHCQIYEAYMNQVASGTTDQKQMPKLPDHVFSVIRKGLNADGTMKTFNDSHDIAFYLPDLYTAFQKAFPVSSHGTNLPFSFLRHLVAMLGITSQSCHLILPGDVIFDVIHRLLRLTCEGCIHDVGVDNENQGQEIKWFRTLAEKLLSLRGSDSPDWYNCFTTLLSLNHDILSPKITELWSKAWLTTQETSQRVINAQNNLFGSMVRVYITLRQVPKLITKVFQLLKESDISTPKTTWPETVLESFGDCVPNLPSAQIFSLWNQFIDDINIHSLQSNNSTSDKILLLMSVMFYTFLVNVRTADFNFALVTAEQVNSLTMKTRDSILIPMAERISSKHERNEDFVRSFLLLTAAFNNLELLLKMYAKNSTSFDSSKQSNDVMKTVDDVGRENVIWSFFTLLTSVTGLHTMLCTQSPPSAIETKVKDLMSVLPSMKYPEAEWNGQVSTITADNCHVAMWSCLCDNLPTLVHFVDEAKIDEVIHIIMRYVEEDNGKLQGSITSVCYNFLRDPSFRECRPLQDAIVRYFLWNVHQVFGSLSSPTSRKKRRRNVLTSLDVFVNLLQTSPPDGPLDIPRVVEEFFNHTSSSLVPLSTTILGKLQQNLKILSWQPLEFYHDNRRGDCIAGLLVILLTTRCHDGSISVNLSTICLQLLHVLLAGGTPAIISPSTERFLILLYDFVKQCDSDSKDWPVFLTAYKQLVSCLTRNHLRWSAGSYLITFIEKVVTDVCLLLTSPDVNDQNSILILETLIILLEAMQKVLRNSSIPVNSRKDYDSCIARVAVIPTLLETQHDHLPSYLLWDVSSALVGYHWRRGDQPQIIVNLQPVFALALDGIHLDRDPFHIKSCLGFISRVIKYSHSSPTQGFDLENMVEVSMATLMSLLRQIHQKNLEKGLKKKDSKTVECTSCREHQIGSSHAGVHLVEGSGAEFASNMTESEYDLIERQTEDTIAVLFSFCNEDQVVSVLHDGMKEMTADHIWAHPAKVSVWIRVWKKLLTAEADKKKNNLIYISQNMLLCLRSFLQEINTMTEVDDDIIQNILEPVLDIHTIILTFVQVRVPPNLVVTAPLDHHLSSAAFFTVFHGVYEILNTILMKHPATVLTMIPAIVAAGKRLLDALITHSDQDGECANQVEQLVQCAGSLERLFALMASHKEDFSKVALYLVAEYVTSLQKVTLIPAVKKALLPGIHLLLDLCDQHSTAVLHTVLTPGVKEIFKMLYQDYRKHYKYTGRI